jgi:hypothetical protein
MLLRRTRLIPEEFTPVGRTAPEAVDGPVEVRRRGDILDDVHANQSLLGALGFTLVFSCGPQPSHIAQKVRCAELGAAYIARQQRESPGILFSHVGYAYNVPRDACLCSFRTTDSSGFLDEIVDTTSNQRLIVHATPPIGSPNEITEAEYESKRRELMGDSVAEGKVSGK